MNTDSLLLSKCQIRHPLTNMAWFQTFIQFNLLVFNIKAVWRPGLEWRQAEPCRTSALILGFRLERCFVEHLPGVSFGVHTTIPHALE